MKAPARVLIVDDHPIYRAGLSRSLSERDEFEVCGEGASADEAVTLAQSLSPDIVLLDLSMPGGGQSALTRIVGDHPQIKVIVLTASEDDEDVFQALRAGAAAYVLKGIGADELSAIVSGTLGGESYVSPGLAARILADLKSGQTSEPATKPNERLEQLTAQEDAILHLVSKGLANKRIARDLGLQEKTIKNHMTRILAKLRVRNRVEAAMLRRDAKTSRD